MPKAFRSGDIVRLVQHGGSLSEARYVYDSTDPNPNYCWIREPGIAPNGKTYAVQRWMPSMLKHCPDEARLDQRVRDITSGKIKEGPELLARLFARK
jgi:hypothetical protein